MHFVSAGGRASQLTAFGSFSQLNTLALALSTYILDLIVLGPTVTLAPLSQILALKIRSTIGHGAIRPHLPDASWAAG